MKTEIEAKFTNVDIAEIRIRLEKAGAHLEVPMRLMRRVVIEEPHHTENDGFVRVRDEGDKVTVTYKQRDGQGLHGVKEIETTVGDFDTMVELLSAAGWPYLSYQESRRETWHLGDVEVVIDEWPWIDPYIEIEGLSEDAVRAAASTLGFDWDTAMFGSVDNIYERDYPDMTNRGVIDTKEVRFGDDVPAEFGEKKA